MTAMSNSNTISCVFGNSQEKCQADVSTLNLFELQRLGYYRTNFHQIGYAIVFLLKKRSNSVTTKATWKQLASNHFLFFPIDHSMPKKDSIQTNMNQIFVHRNSAWVSRTKDHRACEAVNNVASALVKLRLRRWLSKDTKPTQTVLPGIPSQNPSISQELHIHRLEVKVVN